MQAEAPVRLTQYRPYTGEDSPGFRRKLEEAQNSGYALLDCAPSVKNGAMWYATLPYPRPDGRRIIGGYTSQHSARLVLERLGYRVKLDITKPRGSKEEGE